MSYENLAFLSPTLVPAKYLCISCGNIVYPDHNIKDQAEKCEELICFNCEHWIDKCTNHGHPFTKSVRSSEMYEEIGKLYIRCANFKNCKWIGPLSDYTLHMKSCTSGSPQALKVKDQNTQDLANSTQEMAKRYENAYFFWSWQDEMVNGVPVLSEIRRQNHSMCAFFSTTSTFEAVLRIKGKNVKNLSWKQLYSDYLKEITKPNAPKKSKLVRLAEILKEKGMLELSSDGIPLQPEVRWKISDFKKFKMNTKQGIEAALKHMKEVGPIVCLYAITSYQALNNKSAGIIHDLEMFESLEYNRGSAVDGQRITHAVCAVGIGAEDLIPYLPYQNSAGVEYQDEGFGRVLPSSILEAVGFFIDEDCERPLKRAKVGETSQQLRKR